jgi:hypothetical protein
LFAKNAKNNNISDDARSQIIINLIFLNRHFGEENHLSEIRLPTNNEMGWNINIQLFKEMSKWIGDSDQRFGIFQNPCTEKWMPETLSTTAFVFNTSR